MMKGITVGYTWQETPGATPSPLPPAVPAKLPCILAIYMKQDTLAQAFISFKDVAAVSARCDTRLFEISYPLIGRRVTETSRGMTAMELGREIILQLSSGRPHCHFIQPSTAEMSVCMDSDTLHDIRSHD